MSNEPNNNDGSQTSKRKRCVKKDKVFPGKVKTFVYINIRNMEISYLSKFYFIFKYFMALVVPTLFRMSHSLNSSDVHINILSHCNNTIIPFKLRLCIPIIFRCVYQ